MKTQYNFFISVLICLWIIIPGITARNSNPPDVFTANPVDKIAGSLRKQAAAYAGKVQLSGNIDNYLAERDQLCEQILSHAKAERYEGLPLDLTITHTRQQEGYRIENICFQSPLGIYATANLYIPAGEGPFPAVISTHGHWTDGRRTEIVQTTAQLLAMNGFVCLTIDAWGAGERTTFEHQHEYHGANLGASLMDIGKTLLGMQLTDNIRGVDLLCSLPYVDAANIGVTGASGGGNQSMWLAAVDQRVKAVVPVVSVGSFLSYIMNSNCVCELLPGGLTFMEEDKVLGLIAPRFLRILTAMNDANPSFTPIEMIPTYHRVERVYQALDVPERIDYRLFNTGHGYWPDMQRSMLEWFNEHLREVPQPLVVQEPVLLPVETLATFPGGERSKGVITTENYCRIKGEEYRANLLSATFSPAPEQKRQELRRLLAVKEDTCKEVHAFTEEQGWSKLIIETTGGRLIPLLYREPSSNEGRYTVVSWPEGKHAIPAGWLEKVVTSGNGVVLVDLWGTGESSSPEAIRIDGALPAFHTLSRSLLWLGETVMGKWVIDLETVTSVVTSYLNAMAIDFAGYRETAIATLFFAALNQPVGKISLYDAPVSYLFDNHQAAGYFNMATHLPGFLLWGDLSLAAALTGTEVCFYHPVKLSGTQLNKNEQATMQQEYLLLQQKIKGTGTLLLIDEE